MSTKDSFEKKLMNTQSPNVPADWDKTLKQHLLQPGKGSVNTPPADKNIWPRWIIWLATAATLLVVLNVLYNNGSVAPENAMEHMSSLPDSKVGFNDCRYVGLLGKFGIVEKEGRQILLGIGDDFKGHTVVNISAKAIEFEDSGKTKRFLYLEGMDEEKPAKPRKDSVASFMIKGTITDDLGNPAGQVSVSAISPDGRFMNHSVTRKNGQYAIKAYSRVNMLRIRGANIGAIIPGPWSVDSVVDLNLLLNKKISRYAGIVLDEKGKAVEDASVDFFCDGDPQAVLGVRSDADGKFKACINTEITWITATKFPDFDLNGNQGNKDGKDRVMAKSGWTVLTEAPFGDLENIVLGYNPDAYFEIHGAVTDEQGNALSNAQIISYSPLGRAYPVEAPANSEQPFTGTQSKEDGSYRVKICGTVPGLMAKRYGAIAVALKIDGPFKALLKARDSLAADFNAKALKAFTVTGSVTNTDGKATKADIVFLDRHLREIGRARTDEKGSYSLLTNIEIGAIRAEQNGAPHLEQQVNIVIKSDSRQDFDFRQNEAKEFIIKGNVTDMDGNPVENASIGYATEKNRCSGDHTGKDGKFEIRQSRRIVEVWAVCNGYRVRLKGGWDKDGEISLAAKTLNTIVISGTVKTAAGTAIQAADIVAYREGDDQDYGWAFSDKDGNYKLLLSEPADYIKVWANGRQMELEGQFDHSQTYNIKTE